MSRCHFLSPHAIAVLVIFLSSCKQEKAEAKKEGLNPQLKSYLDDLAAKEKSNIEKGWAHVEGEGYHYDRPEGWTESKDIKKGVYFLLTSPDGDLKIRLTSRYTESIPEGVRDLNDLVRLQYSLMGISEALEETREIDVPVGDALEAFITIHDTHVRVRYFSNAFNQPENHRMWLLYVMSNERSRLDSPEVRSFLDTFRVDNFRWLNLGDQ
jgi:hypothetical protein